MRQTLIAIALSLIYSCSAVVAAALMVYLFHVWVRPPNPAWQCSRMGIDSAGIDKCVEMRRKR